MEGKKIWCANSEAVSLWMQHGRLRGDQGQGAPAVLATVNGWCVVLDAAGVAEAAGWLLGWLAEHAPEERIKLDTCHSAAIAEALRVERDHLKGNLEAMQRKLGEAESNYIFAQTNNGRNVADVIAALDAVGAPEGAPPDRVRALAAERDRLEADRDSLEVERGRLFAENGGLRAQLADALLDKAEGGIAADRRTIADIRALFAGATVTWPEVTRG